MDSQKALKLNKPSKLNTLVRMQFQQKMDVSAEKDKKAILFKVLYTVIGFILATAVLFFVFYIGAFLNVLSLSRTIPDYVLIFLVTIMQLISILSCTYGLMKSFYFSQDNPLLLTFPVMANEVFLSKLIVYYLLELKRSFTFLLPIFIAYGINNYIMDGLSIGDILYFFIVFLSFPVLSLIPIVLGAILSIPAMGLYMLLRQFRLLSMILYVAIATTLTITVFYIVSKIPADFNIVRDFKNYYSGIRTFLIAFSEFFLPFAAISRMVTGKTELMIHTVFPISSFITFLILILSQAAGLAFIYNVNRPLFFRMVSKPFEYKKSLLDHKKKNRRHNKFISGVNKEFLTMLRSPQDFFQSFGMILTLPLAIFLMDKIFASMNTDLLGQFLAVCFNILIILLMLTTSNTTAASLFSKEGKALYLLKTKPANIGGVILAKLTPTLIISSFSMIFTSAIMLRVSMLPTKASVMIFFFAMFINVGHILMSAESDIVNPQYQHYLDGASDITNPNETKSVMSGFMLSFLFFGISLFLYMEDSGIVWYKLTGLAFAFFCYRVWLFVLRTKVHFRDM